MANKFTDKMKPRRILHKKTDFSAVGGRDTYISRKFTVEMKPMQAHVTREFAGGCEDVCQDVSV